MRSQKQALLARAMQHQQAGELAQAEALCQKLVRDDPYFGEAWNLLGIVAYQSGHATVALNHLERAKVASPNAASFRSNRGVILQELGRLSEAEAEHLDAIRIEPDHPDAHNNLGNIYRLLGRCAEAEPCFRRALQLKPAYPEMLDNLGRTLTASGRHDEAAACYRKSLEQRPTAEGHNNFGNVLADLSRREEAVACYRHALELRPVYPEALNNLGTVLQELLRFEEAETCYRRALEMRPQLPETHNNLGNVLQDLERHAEAETCYRQALVLKPDYAIAHNNLANALRSLRRFDEAMICCRRSLELQPANPEARNNLGNILRALGHFAEAEASYRQALVLRPNYVDAFNNLATVLSDLGRNDEAKASFRRALELDPSFVQAHKGLGMVSLLTGDFAIGWNEYEWRWQVPNQKLPPYSQPLWDGSPPSGRTILLHPEQGYGDTLQFIRYAVNVKERGGRVVFHCPEPLLGVLGACAGVDVLAPGNTPASGFDLHFPLMSLPRLFGTTIDTVPVSVPYLSAEPALAATWRERLAAVPGFKVGIVWQGSTKHRGDQFRSVPLTRFATLAQVGGVRLFSMQVGFGAEQMAALNNSFDIVDLGCEFAPSSFNDAAAVLSNLDLLITVDTALAHLAGAMGLPVWVALPFAPDWRWLLEREDSPWYPTMRLFRQPRPGDWDIVFARMAEVLAAKSGQSGGL